MLEIVVTVAGGVYRFIEPVFIVAAVLSLVALVPLGLISGSTRRFASAGMLVASFLFTFTTWLYAVLVTATILGGFWLFVGLFFGGIGVVPVGFVGALLVGAGNEAFGIGFGVALAVGARFLSALWDPTPAP